ncbi:MAG: alpha/beta hydrolase [Notoacmeibacter sp.]|nr:alpha/beta hydrolase [Notoacmeibacter sp.]
MPFIEHRGSFVHYREDGAGAPVVALHASASTGDQWESLTGYLAGRFRVIRPDLPGNGNSSPVGGNGTGLSAIATRLSALFSEIGEPFHLVGHSFGGAVALKVAQTLPWLVRSLVVIEPAAFHLLAEETPKHPDLDGLETVIADMRAACAEGDAAAAMGRFVDFWNGDGAWLRTSRALRAKLARRTGQVMDEFAAISAEHATFADYASIRCPVLAITGRQSPAIAQYLSTNLSRSLPSAELAEIADAGHMAPLTDPHVVDPMIAAHVTAAERLDRVTGASWLAAA